MTTSAPKGLSVKSAAIWQELTEHHKFEAHERVAFERSLRWFDRSDVLLLAADKAEPREAAQLFKLAMDAATSGLRFWRTLKFTDGTAARRPGRPSDADWSRKRQLQAIDKAV
jgi:hypothetical protein